MLAIGKKKASGLSSRLLPKVCAELATREAPCVLDIGMGVPSTLEFLSQYRARVFFLDLANGDTSYEQNLGDYSGALFDVCLFWDFLQSLEPEKLSALSDALTPYVYSGTIGYSICNVSPQRLSHRCSYRIRSEDELELVPSQHKRFREWSQKEFADHFDSFRIEQDVLSHDGHLELLLGVE